MKLRMTFEFDDISRKAIAHHYGKGKKATRKDIQEWLNEVINSTSEILVSEYRADHGDDS